MHEPTAQQRGTQQRGTQQRGTGQRDTGQPGTTRPAAEPVPGFVKYITTPFGLRHANGIAVIRFFVAVWLVCLGAIFCAVGDWWGAFLFVAAALVAALAYFVPRWKLALDAEKSAQGPRLAP